MQDNEFKDGLKIHKIQKNSHNNLMDLAEQYKKSNSSTNREFLCYLTAAIYLTTKKFFPQLSIYIPFRTKSDMSYIKNIQKEIPKSIMKSKDLTTELDTVALQKDISGVRIVLDDINGSRPAKGESEQILNDPDIQKLSPYYKKTSKDVSHVEFIKQVEQYLYSPIKSNKEYYRLRKDLLHRILEITPKEFTDERKPQPSFKQLYDDTCYQYNYFSESDEFPPVKPSDELELSKLLDDFRSRSNDQYHFAILRKILPIVLNDPLVKNALKTNSCFEKELKKTNGFQSIYYSLESPFGSIELQAQSNKAYYASTKGSAYHSGMDGKTVNVKGFFELVDPNDENDISYYLDKLDSISADTLVSPYEIPEFKNKSEKAKFMATPEGIRYQNSEKCREMMNHIKIKDTIQILSTNNLDGLYDRTGNIDSDKLQERINSGEKITMSSIDANEYLFSTALSLSPYMNVCSSGHTSTTTATIHHKKLIGEFAEILRKKDSNTCLREMLIRRLETLIVKKGITDKDDPSDKDISDSMKDMLKIATKHEKIASKLPRDISRKNILNYAEKLRKKLDKKANAEKTDEEFTL